MTLRPSRAAILAAGWLRGQSCSVLRSYASAPMSLRRFQINFPYFRGLSGYFDAGNAAIINEISWGFYSDVPSKPVVAAGHRNDYVGAALHAGNPAASSAKTHAG